MRTATTARLAASPRFAAARRSTFVLFRFDRVRRVLLLLALSLVTATATAAPASERPEKQELKIGFIKLTDCAPLIVAYEKGYFEEEGLYVTLEAQANWKIVLDRVIDGSLDASHMLPGQVLGSAVGIGPRANLVAVAGMGINTLAITVSNNVWARMKPSVPQQNGKPTHPIRANALQPVIAAANAGGRRFTMGMAFPTSTHNYALRYWLAAGGVHPGYYTPRDANGTTGGTVSLSVTPPPQMPATLGAGTIFGFSGGEPWNQQAVLKNIGVPVITATQIWSRTPEKVLGLRKELLDRNPRTVRALVRAVIRAEQWLDAGNGQANRRELARMLARPEYVGADANVLLGPLTGRYRFERGDVRPVPAMNLYYRSFAGYPFYADAVWYLTQMRRWGQIASAKPDAWYDRIARATYRPDVYRAAAQSLVTTGRMAAGDLPAANAYSAGAGRFIDGISFDPLKPNAYLAQFAIGQQGRNP